MKEAGHSWENISAEIEGSTPIKCQRRYERVMKMEKKWPKEVDDLIIRLREE